MKCPVCPDATLVMTDRQGIEIDYCPQCRGVWLDRGELDKIIDRASADVAPVRQAPQAQAPQPPPLPPRQHHGHSSHGYDPHYYKHKKKKGLLGELFDF
ncbi:MAG TPA: zf-TFIIB domain-containing protein [Xanthomonadaceae bacterium]|jgi:Zn-finger nucleic acid-binding protein|nr:zf-TFIIB domain-containing protein [Xanthomonadaceae bacterium]